MRVGRRISFLLMLLKTQVLSTHVLLASVSSPPAALMCSLPSELAMCLPSAML